MAEQFQFDKLDLEGAYMISPFYVEDRRGYFLKDVTNSLFEKNGIDFKIKENFYSFSKKGTIRGVHFQYDNQQTKLVRCIKGRIYDVIVDLRVDSPTYKQWRGFYLDENNHKSLLVPKYFGHGFFALEDSLVSYKCDQEFYEPGDSGIRWSDNDINIQWPIEEVCKLEELIISNKDQCLQSFKEYDMKERGK